MGIYNDVNAARQQYENSLDMVRKHRAGYYKGKSLEGAHWENVSRQRAVKFGNILKTMTGSYPESYGEVALRRRK